MCIISCIYNSTNQIWWQSWHHDTAYWWQLGLLTIYIDFTTQAGDTAGDTTVPADSPDDTAQPAGTNKKLKTWLVKAKKVGLVWQIHVGDIPNLNGGTNRVD